MLTRLGFALLAVASLNPLLTSCGNTERSESKTLAITNRPQKEETRKIVLLKFKTPALFSTAKYLDKKLVIDKDQEKALDLEQDTTEKFLKDLSREIKILHRYRFVLNGFSVLVPTKYADELKKHAGIAEVHDAQSFSKPEVLATGTSSVKVGPLTSVKFIGADKVHKEMNVLDKDGKPIPVDGKGIRVGVIDTGIDYTHKMFGGTGTEDAYKAINPTIVTRSAFPNKKVVGGTDLVGTDYDDNSKDFNRHIPQPDANPIDESGHGTHVAGTIAGIGDDENTYSGVAPGADLYAIKVFGKNGSTSDAVVIAALEYAANPSGNRNPEDHLDLVNLSLGSPFGMPHRLYDEAIANIENIGMIPVTSAGNSGNIPYIVGSPGASTGAISVASSIDYMEHNWKFRAVRFKTPKEEVLTKAVESPMAKPLESIENLTGKLVYIGLANTDLTEEQKKAVHGNVALIDRGGSVFQDKIKRAVDAGAIGVVVASNSDGEPIVMGGEGKFDVPAIMITKVLGLKLKTALAAQEEVTGQFGIPERVEEPKLIDTISSFSSRGPRSFDSEIKPEIAAPGTNIVSAKVGSGFKGTIMSGTSMASPHAAGCVALIKQFRPNWNPKQIKSALMESSLSIRNREGAEYSIASQGAGRVDIFNALNVKITTSPASIALGDVEVVHKKELVRELNIENLTDKATTVYFKVLAQKELHFDLPDHVVVPAHGQAQVPVTTVIDAPTEVNFLELSAYINLVTEDDEVLAKIPVLAQVRRLSLMRVESLKGHATCSQDAEGCPTDLRLRNDGAATSPAYIFNLIGTNPRLNTMGPEKRLTEICDLESVGYRTLDKGTGLQRTRVLQIAAKLHSPLTNWEHCELSVQIDGDGDGIVDQEMIGSSQSSLNPAAALDKYSTLLTDAKIMKRIRAEYERSPKNDRPDYSGAVLEMDDLQVFDHGTLMILTMPLSKLQVQPFGLLKVKIASLAAADPLSTPDNFLGLKSDFWWTIDPFEKANPYFGMPESVDVPAQSSVDVKLVHGENEGNLVVYFPLNRSARGTGKDLQSDIAKEEFIYK